MLGMKAPQRWMSLTTLNSQILLANTCNKETKSSPNLRQGNKIITQSLVKPKSIEEQVPTSQVKINLMEP